MTGVRVSPLAVMALRLAVTLTLALAADEGWRR